MKISLTNSVFSLSSFNIIYITYLSVKIALLSDQQELLLEARLEFPSRSPVAGFPHSGLWRTAHAARDSQVVPDSANTESCQCLKRAAIQKIER